MSIAATPTPSTVASWSHPDHVYRVHHYDPRRKGTWFAYFSDLASAEAFAVGRRLYAEPAVVQTRGAL